MIKMCITCGQTFEVKAGYRVKCRSCNPTTKLCSCGRTIGKWSKRCKECDTLYKKSRTGINNPFFKRGWYKDKNGYIQITAGVKSEKIAQHRFIWEQAHGKLSKGWVIHHLNGIKDDNRLENLFALPHNGHMSIHRIQGSELVKRLRERIAELEAQLRTH